MASPISPASYNSLAEIRQDIVDHQRAQAQRAVLVAKQNVLNVQLQTLEAQKAQALANKGAAEARKQGLEAQQAQALAKKAEAIAKKEQSQARIAQLNELMKLVQAAPTRPAPAIHRPAPGSPPKA